MIELHVNPVSTKATTGYRCSSTSCGIVASSLRCVPAGRCCISGQRCHCDDLLRRSLMLQNSGRRVFPCMELFLFLQSFFKCPFFLQKNNCAFLNSTKYSQRPRCLPDWAFVCWIPSIAVTESSPVELTKGDRGSIMIPRSVRRIIELQSITVDSSLFQLVTDLWTILGHWRSSLLKFFSSARAVRVA
jgi:hypothetical protein